MLSVRVRPGAPALLLLPLLSNQLRHLRVRSDRLDENEVRVETHAVRFVKLFAPLDERVRDLLRFRIPLADDVVDVRQDGMRSAIVLEVAEIHGAVCKEHGLVRSGKLHG